MTTRAGRKVYLAADLALRLGVRHMSNLSQFNRPVRVPSLAAAATVRAQNLAANAAIGAHFRNQNERGLPVRIGAGTQLDDIPDADCVVSGGSACPVEQRFEYEEFLRGEHPVMIPSLSGSVLKIDEEFISSFFLAPVS